VAKDAVAKAIDGAFGQGDNYGGNITDAVYAAGKLIANSIDGCEYGDRSEPSLCKSIDGVAAALIRIAEALEKKP
jgi:hypothetical protein